MLPTPSDCRQTENGWVLFFYGGHEVFGFVPASTSDLRSAIEAWRAGDSSALIDMIRGGQREVLSAMGEH